MNKVHEAYLDNSSTTRVYSDVFQEMKRVMDQEYGNPSSLHRRGTSAERIFIAAQEELAELLGVKAKSLIFTSGGTESNNLAVLGIARRNRRHGNHLVTTAVEHPSVLAPFKRLETEGFEVTYIKPNALGIVDPNAVEQAVTTQTVLTSIMHVNNETGAVMPIERLARVVKARNPKTIFHVDAIQSFTKMPLAPVQQGIDALSLSAHKFHGPKGVGALYLREGILVEPLFGGGGQQQEIRPGTENNPGIAGMALAARISMEHLKTGKNLLKSYREKMIAILKSEHPDLRINGPDIDNAAPHILNVSFPGIKGEIMLHALEEHHIFVSTGSACHARIKEASHVLQAMGLSPETIESAVRISFSWMNTEKEVIYAAEKMIETVNDFKAFMQRSPGRG